NVSRGIRCRRRCAAQAVHSRSIGARCDQRALVVHGGPITLRRRRSRVHAHCHCRQRAGGLRLIFGGWPACYGRWVLRGQRNAPRSESQSYTAPVMTTRRTRRRPWTDHALFVVVVGPNVALLLLFIYRPLADNIRLSFFDWNISDPTAQFVGLSNYAEWFTRSDTRQVVLNTAGFTASAVIGSMVLGLLLAMLLDQPLRGRNLVRSTVFAPFVISGAAVGLAAQFVFDPHFGLVQDLSHRIGFGVPDFYQDPHWALFMVTVTYIWKNLGYTFVIYLAALQGVRRDLLEAAEIDGASRWATF